MRRRLPAAGLLLFAVVLALLALQSGLDRLSPRNPALAVQVAAPFASEALVVRAKLVSERQDFTQAEALARAALRRAPLAADAASMLGASLLSRGRFAEAEAPFRLAAMGGWRDPATQLYWATAAMQAGEAGAAAQRLDAVLRTGAGREGAVQGLAFLERSGAGRAALAERLSAGAPWISDYAARAATGTPDQFAARMTVLDAAFAAGARPDCRSLFGLVGKLAAQPGRVADANRLWRIACAANPEEGAIANGDFSAAETRYRTPFDWNLTDTGTAFGAISNGVLQLGNSTAAPVEVARQVLVLPPGSYALRWRFADAATRAPGSLFTLRCGGTALPLGDIRRDADGYAAGLVVPQGCPAQELTVTAPPDTAMLRLDSVDVTRRR